MYYERAKPYFYPHSNERKYFFDLAYPGSAIKSDNPLYNWAPKFDNHLSPERIRLKIKALLDNELTIDELTQAVYGFTTFGAFIDYTQDEQKTDTVKVSKQTEKILRSEPLSANWIKEIAVGRVNPMITSWLEDLGDRKSTHSSVGLLFEVRISEVHPYTEAALIGFKAINFVISNNGGKFKVKPSRESGELLVDKCCWFRGTATCPLDMIDESVREFVDGLIDGLDQRMKAMLGEKPTTEKFFFSTDPMPYRDTLWAAASGGAMMACVGFDPSECRFYDGLGRSAKAMDPHDAPWFSR